MRAHSIPWSRSDTFPYYNLTAPPAVHVALPFLARNYCATSKPLLHQHQQRHVAVQGELFGDAGVEEGIEQAGVALRSDNAEGINGINVLHVAMVLGRPPILVLQSEP